MHAQSPLVVVFSAFILIISVYSWADSALLHLAMNQCDVVEDFLGQSEVDEAANEKMLDDAMVILYLCTMHNERKLHIVTNVTMIFEIRLSFARVVCGHCDVYLPACLGLRTILAGIFSFDLVKLKYNRLRVFLVL